LPHPLEEEKKNELAFPLRYSLLSKTPWFPYWKPSKRCSPRYAGHTVCIFLWRLFLY